jgi:hypothetical protein
MFTGIICHIQEALFDVVNPLYMMLKKFMFIDERYLCLLAQQQSLEVFLNSYAIHLQIYLSADGG